MKKLILIDGNAVIHRAFHALPPFKTTKGELVNAVYGFSSILLNLINGEKPDFIAVCFDMAKKTFRHEEYKDYKATRKKAPDELYAQIPRIREIVKTFEIPIYEEEGYEADDVLGALAQQAEKTGEIKTYIFTGDKDTLQLVTENINVLMPTKGLKEPMTYDVQKVLGKFGLSPKQIPDLKGLQGDASDNIKGVKGIGPKTARTLLQKYGNLENIYSNLNEIKGATKEKLQKDKESAFFSRRMATLITDLKTKLDINACITHEYDQQKIQKLFTDLEFHSLLPRLNKFGIASEEKKKEESMTQPSLF